MNLEQERIKNVVECSNCGELIDADNVEEYEGNYYCNECFDDLFVECADCGEVVSRDECSRVNDNSICESCIDDNYTWCDHCNEYHNNDDMITCDWCDDSTCPELIHNDNNGTEICEYCYENHSYTCESCGELVHCDNSYYSEHDGCNYCEHCYNQLDNDLIYDYSYKPDPIFYGNGPRFFGVELEVDDGDNRESAAESITDDNYEVYCKHDSSLNCGFEIVSHPCSLEYHLESLNWQRIMDIARNNDFTSHDAETCGMHVHISRRAFGYTYPDQELNIIKLIYLVEKFWNQVKNFSRRTDEQINRWAKNYGLLPDESIEDLHVKTRYANRYFAVNLENSATIEIRIFRGTLKHNTFAATLQFCDLLVDTAIYGGIEDIRQLTWNDIVKGARNYPELTSYLQERGLDN